MLLLLVQAFGPTTEFCSVNLLQTESFLHLNRESVPGSTPVLVSETKFGGSDGDSHSQSRLQPNPSTSILIACLSDQLVYPTQD